MKSLWYAIKSEVVKLRHTPIFLLHIIVPLLGGLLFAMYFHLYSGQQSITQRLNLILQATSAFFPLAISIAVSLGINLEEEGHFQALFVGMESKSKLIIAKLILFLGIGAVAIVILFLPILFSVAVMDQELILIDLSKNTGEIPINRESISIGKFIDSIKGQMQSVVAMKKMNLIIAIMDESFRIEIDTVLMERAIINVLSNAVDHSPTHGEIIFNVTKDKGKCKISIIDSGPGFTPAALKYGLERFFMDDKSRNYQHHYGMELYITNSIVTQHGGKVELKNKRGAEVDIII